MEATLRKLKELAATLDLKEVLAQGNFKPTDLLCISSHSRFVAVSPSWTNLLGWSADELTHSDYLAFVHPDDRQRTVEFLPTLKDHGEYYFLNRYRDKKGKYHWLKWRVTQPTDKDLIDCVARIQPEGADVQ